MAVAAKDPSSHTVPEPFDPDPLLRWVLGLLVVAFILELYVSEPWTEPFFDWDTWVLFGIFLGFGFRLLARRLGETRGVWQEAFRRAGLVVWAVSAVGGLLAWLFS